MGQDKWFRTKDVDNTEVLRPAFMRFLKTPGQIRLKAKRNCRQK